MKQELLKGLTEEQIAKIKACNNSEKLLALAKEEGVELTDEQLSAVSGGHCMNEFDCPNCGKPIESGTHCDKDYNYVCPHCGHRFHRQNIEASQSF